MRMKEIIVVEGRDDTAKIKQAIDADTIETNGSAINDDILEQIRHAKQKRGVIIFTDPDYPGKRIRHIIDEAVPGCKHAFLTKNEAKQKHKKSLGIEHATLDVIRQALSQVYEIGHEIEPEITKEMLYQYGLIGGKKASSRRDALTKELRIGHANGKQLLKRLQMFHITKEQFDRVMNEIIQEEEDE
ncbi:RNAse M5 [Pelagirhabdus alkalitolerans]|uniref:Ribonuclease M5 n=1 Tax=Pelagirhabdus alkalitolerans TaxID=1612202 RepID=A0A1G6MLK2_9BACI|nr:ribonuclease M5 [Pelagirhabdus alkalitolerans]SDC55866.1 RNAse M5 [Pelagirhabdus alkalitolerans]